jgi:hypothetical protein
VNGAREFYAQDLGDAGARWLRDDSLREYPSPRPGIDVTLWDPRAYIAELDQEGARLVVRIGGDVARLRACHATFHQHHGWTSGNSG